MYLLVTVYFIRLKTPLSVHLLWYEFGLWYRFEYRMLQHVMPFVFAARLRKEPRV